MSTIKQAISFRELRDELMEVRDSIEIVLRRYYNAHLDGVCSILTSIIDRIDTEAITYGHSKATPGADDAHKMPSWEYWHWRYEFAKAALPVCMQDNGELAAAYDALRYADAMLDALEEAGDG